MTSPPPTKPFTIAIIGGGLGGLLLALGLSTRNINFHIFESAPAFTETSAGIGFGPNAIRAMALLDPRIAGFYNELCTENGWESKRNTWFDFRMGESEELELVAELKLTIDGREEDGTQQRSGNVLRARMLEELVKLLPEGRVSFRKRVMGVKQKRGGVELRFADGSMEVVDAVVGCDGIRSVVRSQLLGDDHEASSAVFTQMYVYRGLLNMKDAIDAVGEELAINSQVYMGHDGMVVTYPIERGKVLNVVAFHASKEITWNHQKWVVESSREEMLKDFGNFEVKIRNLVKLCDSPQKWAIFDMPPAPTYSSGLVTLLGDAAHASTSHGGAGAGMGVEDALILSELLSQPEVRQIGDLPIVFKTYDTVRRSRTQRLVRHSREAGIVYSLRLPAIGDIVEKLSADLNVRQRWIWDIDLKEQIQEAKKILKQSMGNL